MKRRARERGSLRMSMSMGEAPFEREMEVEG